MDYEKVIIEAKRIKILRRVSLLSFKELAYKLQTYPLDIFRIESGRRKSFLNNLDFIADRLQTSVNWLKYGDNTDIDKRNIYRMNLAERVLNLRESEQSVYILNDTTGMHNDIKNYFNEIGANDMYIFLTFLIGKKMDSVVLNNFLKNMVSIDSKYIAFNFISPLYGLINIPYEYDEKMRNVARIVNYLKLEKNCLDNFIDYNKIKKEMNCFETITCKKLGINPSSLIISAFKNDKTYPSFVRVFEKNKYIRKNKYEFFVKINSLTDKEFTYIRSCKDIFPQIKSKFFKI